MRTIRFNVLTFVIILFAVLGCQEFLSINNVENPSSDKGYFSLVIGGVNSERTILPILESSYFAKYKLEFFAEGTTENPVEVVEKTGEDLSDPIQLSNETYDLYVTAFLDVEMEIIAAYGSISNIEIQGGGTVTESIILITMIMEEGEGTFKWDINYPENVNFANMTITPLLGTEAAEQILFFTGGTPAVDKNNADTPLTLSAGYYRVVFNLRNSSGEIAYYREILHIYKDMNCFFPFTFTANYFSDTYIVTSNENAGTGTLREAITILNEKTSGGTIIIDSNAGTIELESALPQITRSIGIEGNGITITRSSLWTTTSTSSQLLRISSTNSPVVKISRVHFKDGRAIQYGAAIDNRGNLTLESCIFSGNQTSETSGGAIYNSGTMSVKGCTFYRNSTASRGGAIYNGGGSLTLTGNLFYGNTADSAANGHVVYLSSGTVTSQGYNVVDVALGSSNTQSGFAAIDSDKRIGTALPVSPKSFKLLSGSEALNVITVLPSGYPTVDFYGDPISANAVAGAAQSIAIGNYLDVTVNYAGRGGFTVITAPNDDGLYPSDTMVEITAESITPFEFGYWLVNGENNGINAALQFSITGHTRVQAVFSYIAVSNFTDTTNAASTPGTLRYAITNVSENDIICFKNVTPGTSVIPLASALPEITRSISIEGNSITITRSSSWTATSASSQLLRISSTNSPVVKISRVHFKDGRATGYGAAIYNRGNLTLESCIFSGNQTSDSSTYGGGGAINSGTMSVKGCTFYRNTANRGGAIYIGTGTLTLTGNLFYGNTASSAENGHVVYRGSGTVTSQGCNVVDVALGSSNEQSGFTATDGDKRIGTALPVSPKSFKLLSESGAANVITALPSGYPTADFYGDLISANAASGAVQENINGFFIDVSENYSARGSVNITPAPDAEGAIPSRNVMINAIPVSPYEFGYWVVNGEKNDTDTTLSLDITELTIVKAVFILITTVDNFSDESNPPPGTLRYALTHNGGSVDDIIRFSGVTPGVSVLELAGQLTIYNHTSIEGNGITITRSSSWTANDSSLIRIEESINPSIVKISRVHFKDGRGAVDGAAIHNRGILTLESCIFSGNQTSNSSNWGGAIMNNYGTVNVKGCTFFGNSSAYGGAISNYGGTLTLIGNLFKKNTANSGAYGHVVHRSSGTVTSQGYNVVDISLGSANAQSGFENSTGTDKVIDTPLGPITLINYNPISGIGAESVITNLPEDYPTFDFYGDLIQAPAAAGAVQQIVSLTDLTSYNLQVTTNKTAFIETIKTGTGSSAYGNVLITAKPVEPYRLTHWLVNGENAGTANELFFEITENTSIQAEFVLEVYIFTDTANAATTPGTLRYAITNALANDIISIAATNELVQLSSPLPQITRSLTIEGNSITIRPYSSYTASSTSQLIRTSSAATTTINRVHFLNGKATTSGGAVRNDGTMTLNSCIFSGNKTSDSSANGGAIFNGGTMYVRGCSFYGNGFVDSAATTGRGGAIYNNANPLYLTGNLFYGNVAGSATLGPTVIKGGVGTITSRGYNIVDIALGTGNNQSGFASIAGDSLYTGIGFADNTTLPFSTSSFLPVATGTLRTHIPETFAGSMPETDFNGAKRTWPGAPGAVKQP